jgi:hypothetical protein
LRLKRSRPTRIKGVGYYALLYTFDNLQVKQKNIFLYKGKKKSQEKKRIKGRKQS